MLTMTATQADRNSKLERDTLCSKPRDRRYFALVISGECLCSEALVIRSFLQQGLRPGANRTVVTQLEKLQLFWQLAMQQKKKNPIYSDTAPRSQFFIERSCKYSSTDLAALL